MLVLGGLMQKMSWLADKDAALVATLRPIVGALRYTWAGLLLKPFVELRANAISGDRDPNDAELNSFNALSRRASISARSVSSDRATCSICTRLPRR
jgi:hypothetical protein